MNRFIAFVRFADGTELSLSRRFASDRAASLEAMSLARELKAQGEPVAQTGWYDDAPCQVSQQA